MTATVPGGGSSLPSFPKSNSDLQASLVRFLLALGAFGALIAVFILGFHLMRLEDLPKWLNAILALLIGVGGIWGLYLSMYHLVDYLPSKARSVIRPYVFIAPAMIILGVYIIYPSLRTIYISFFDYSRGRPIENFGFQNYIAIFKDPNLIQAVKNNLVWLITVPLFSVSLGLIIAVMVDRIRWERVAKSLIFLPMAISFVGAAVIWRFIYYLSLWGEQIGLLNAIIVFLGKEPVGWLRLEPWNTFFLINIVVWLQTGFAMMILSAAVKGVPSSLLEAARIDGAGEIRIFFQIIIPSLASTILTVTTTIVISVLKIFDVIFVMTSGRFNTDVIANMMYNQMFVQGQYGQGAAVAVLIFLAVIPVMIRNIRNLNKI